jgi:hypothetical protein
VFNSHFYYSGCSVFRRGPCFPNYLPPIGQDLQLTIVSTDENAAADKLDDAGADQRPLDSIRDMFTGYGDAGYRLQRMRRIRGWNTRSGSH